MPKKQPDLCMLCGGSPCECDGSKTKKRSKPPAKVTTKPSETTSSSVESDSDTEDVFAEIPISEKSKFKSASRLDEEPDLSYYAALRLLLPLLGVEARREAEKELNRPYPQSVDRRIADWKNHVQASKRTQQGPEGS